MKTDHIAVLTHSSIKVQCEAGTVYFDPFHIPEESHDADAILITHEHYDHFSPEDIKKIAKDSLPVIDEMNFVKFDGNNTLKVNISPMIMNLLKLIFRI